MQKNEGPIDFDGELRGVRNLENRGVRNLEGPIDFGFVAIYIAWPRVNIRLVETRSPAVTISNDCTDGNDDS